MKIFTTVCAVLVWAAGIPATCWAFAQYHQIGSIRTGCLAGLIFTVSLFGGAHLYFARRSNPTPR